MRRAGPCRRGVPTGRRPYFMATGPTADRWTAGGSAVGELGSQPQDQQRGARTPGTAARACRAGTGSSQRSKCDASAMPVATVTASATALPMPKRRATARISTSCARRTGAIAAVRTIWPPMKNAIPARCRNRTSVLGSISDRAGPSDRRAGARSPGRAPAAGGRGRAPAPRDHAGAGRARRPPRQHHARPAGEAGRGWADRTTAGPPAPWPAPRRMGGGRRRAAGRRDARRAPPAERLARARHFERAAARGGGGHRPADRP